MRRALIPAVALALLAPPVQAGAPDVVTDIPVIHSLVAQVMGDLGSPGLLLEQGADAHDFQLRPSQIRALTGADLVIWTGPEMTPWLDRALGAEAAPQSLSLLHATGTTLREFGAPSESEDHGHDDTDDGHGHGALDPHAWLDPDNAALWIGLITDALVAQDPGNAVAYRANASLAQMRIATLDQMLGEKLAATAAAPIVVAHDAYGYFADHFGLTIAASLAEGDAAAPGAAHLSEIRALLEGGGAACIFPEVARDPTPVLSLAEGTDARVGAALDPEGRAIEPGPMLYGQLIESLGATLIDCLSGA